VWIGGEAEERELRNVREASRNNRVRGSEGKRVRKGWS